MLKKTLIAAATAVALAGFAVATTPATAAVAGYTDVSWKGGYKGHHQWQGPKHGGYRNWKPRRACQPIIRWKKVGYRYHRRWQPIVVGWDCYRGRGGHRGYKGYNNNWK